MQLPAYSLLCTSTAIALCLLHAYTDKTLIQIPCLAIKSTVHCYLRELSPPIIGRDPSVDLVPDLTPHLLVVKHTIMDAVRR